MNDNTGSHAAPSYLSLPLRNLPLRPSTLSTLVRHGFQTTGEVDRSRKLGGVSNLASELGCDLSEAAALQREVESARRSVTGECRQRDGEGARGVSSSATTADDPPPPGGRTVSPTGVAVVSAADLLQNQNGTAGGNPIVTFCRGIDDMLGGGVAPCEVTEIVGVPGAGKTQLCIQLAVDARLPREYGGAAGEAVYMDTEGSFAPERCLTMAEALVSHIHSKARDRRERDRGTRGGGANSGRGSSSAVGKVPDWFTPEGILDGIHVFRVHDEASQMATTRSLPTFLREREEMGTPVRIVIIDSVAFHYRSMSDYKIRTRSLTTTAAFLSDLANTFKVAVVVVNQMTTKVGGDGGQNQHNRSSFNADVVGEGGDARLTPALGESWAHATTTRLLLTVPPDGEGDDDEGRGRRCTLVKSPHKPAAEALYRVTEVGIRDVVPTRRVVRGVRTDGEMPRKRLQAAT